MSLKSTLKIQPLLQLSVNARVFLPTASQHCDFSQSPNNIFLALFISFRLVPDCLGVQIDLLGHLISQSWLITFTLVLSKGLPAPQANERTLERVVGARIRF